MIRRNGDGSVPSGSWVTLYLKNSPRDYRTVLLVVTRCIVQTLPRAGNARATLWYIWPAVPLYP